MKPKIIAFYLPQFHEIPENNKWWGKGFTEWTNVKKAMPLFKGHDQPKIPLNKNYYDLLDPKTQEWQARLAKKYGIYGFCYYHYWFKGKKLLEKPAEIMLKTKRPDFPFCFSWANESWSRTWYSSKKETLMQQDYGTKKDWKKHFYYLLRFFKDKRYIKINGKPLLVIYKPSQIKKLDQIIACWNSLAIKEGFGGIYIIETLTASQAAPKSRFSDGVVFYEPGYTLKNSGFYAGRMLTLKTLLSRTLENNPFLKRFTGMKALSNRFDYDKSYKQILSRRLDNFNKKVYLGSFVSFDDTPRRKNRAYIFKNGTPSKFEAYLKSLLLKSSQIGSELLFMTAWNEWAEGAYLEPDKKNKYDYLKAVKRAQKGIFSGI